MISFFQKNTWIVATLIILLILGFLFTLDPSQSAGLLGGQGTQVGDKKYNNTEIQKLGPLSQQIAYRLSYNETAMRSFTTGLSQGFAEDRGYDSGFYFFVNRVVARQGFEKYGISIPQEQVIDYIKTKLFANAGEFDEKIYADFTNNLLIPNGYSEQDLHELVSDALAFEQLQNIVSYGLTETSSFINKGQQHRYQKLDLWLIEEKASDYLTAAKELNPTEEELTTYWEANQADYQSTEKRQFAWIKLKAPQLSDKEEDSESNQQKTKAFRQLTQEVWQQAYDDIANFKNVVASHGLTTTELFTVDTAPQELQTPTALAGTIAQELFLIELDSNDPQSALSNPIADKEGNFFIAKLLSVEPADTLPLAECKEAVTKNWRNTQAERLLEEALQADQDKITQGLADGKDLNELTADFNVTKLPSFGVQDPLPEPYDTREIFLLAGKTDIKSFADESIFTPEGKALIFVYNRQLTLDEEQSRELELDRDFIKLQYKFSAINNWLAQKRDPILDSFAN